MKKNLVIVLLAATTIAAGIFGYRQQQRAENLEAVVAEKEAQLKNANIIVEHQRIISEQNMIEATIKAEQGKK